jgi:CheY-like chemotaxis protein
MNISRKVLIVVVDDVATKNFEQVFSGKGFAVVTASSGEDAIWKLDNDTYDAVLTELEMRGLSGLDLAEEVQAHRPRLPVFIITDSDPNSVQERAAAAGVAGFLRKPLSPEQIAASADQVLKVAESVAALQPKIPEVKVASASPTTVFVARLGNIVLFFLAPIISIIYIIFFPVVGFGALVWLGVTAVRAKRQTSETAAASPLPAHAKPSIPATIVKIAGVALVGIAYGLVSPILGIGALIWFFLEAWGKLGAKAIRASET